jgi:single-strand DNA-binding protein
MRVYGLGRLTRELELKSSTSGTSYLTNSIACDRKYGEKKTDFYEIKAFGKTAEAMDKFLHKGSKIFVDGELQTDEYTDKNGIKKQTTSIVVSSWEFAEAKSESKESSESKNNFINIPDSIIEELPFA